MLTSGATGRAARGELIICTDDDVLVSPGWLSAYLWPRSTGQTPRSSAAPSTRGSRRNLRGGSKEYLVVRGPYSVLQHGAEVRPFLVGEVRPYGANMAFRSSALKNFRFDTRL